MPTTAFATIDAHADLSFRAVGARPHDGGVSFRVWAPNHEAVRVVTGDGATTRYVALHPDPDDAPGYFSGRDERGRSGDLYWYQLAHGLAPDPASRFQPRGVEGPSQIIDPHAYTWQATTWQRPPLRGRVIYELHIGTFTREGTFAAAVRRLDDLVDLGVNAIELMPLGDFAGDRGWGYDGVMIHAPARCYGSPDELRALIDAAHARGLAVIIDAVYNHLGPVGNVLSLFSADYFHHEHGTLWGAGLNFDGPNSAPVRQFFLQNACMWFDEYSVDGLRLDAVHAIRDRSEPHLVAEITAAAHARGAFVIAEDERNDSTIISPRELRGWGADGMWADDFHHTLRVAVTGQKEAHFANYNGTLDEWVRALRDGWIYHGQYFRSWKRERGTPCAHLPPERFVFCISNHDQVGNRPLGDRLSDVVSPEIYRALSMLCCFVPYTPMLFMGQEWATRSPFPFFCDLPGFAGDAIGANRLKEFQHYGATYPAEMLARMPEPQARATFESAKLDWDERERPGHAEILALYRACLRLRAEQPIFQSPPRERWNVERVGDAIVLDWRDDAAMWMLAITVRPGAVLPEADQDATLILASNAREFGGNGESTVGPAAALWRAPL